MKNSLFLGLIVLFSVSFIHTSENNNGSFRAKTMNTIIKYSGPINKYSPTVLNWGYIPTGIAGFVFHLKGGPIVSNCLMGGTLGLSLLYQFNQIRA